MTSQPQIEVSCLIRASYAALRATATGERPATRINCYDALTLADLALERALNAGLDGSLVMQCELVQDMCHAVLRDAYVKSDTHDRVVYEKAASDRAKDEEIGGEGEDENKQSENDGADGAIPWRDVVWE